MHTITSALRLVWMAYSPTYRLQLSMQHRQLYFSQPSFLLGKNMSIAIMPGL